MHMQQAATRLLVGWTMSMAVAACGGDDGEASRTSATSAASTAATDLPATTTSAPFASPPPLSPPTFEPVPPGTMLRVGDQFGLFEGVLGFAGMDDDIPYEIEYSTLTPGPTQIQAFQAGAIDVGVLSPLQLLQAVSGGIEIRGVGRWRTDFALNALVTAPGVDGITGWADLRGKRVAFQRNTLGEALTMLELDRLGMTLDDVTVIDIPVQNIGTVLQHGDADAAVFGEPFVSGYLAANPEATYVLGIEEPLARSTVIVASAAALADPAKAAAIAGYELRLNDAFVELTSDKQGFADLAVAVWGLDRAYVDRVLAESSGVRMEGLPGDLAPAFERLDQLLVERGDIDQPVDADGLFDARYAGLFEG